MASRAGAALRSTRGWMDGGARHAGLGHKAALTSKAALTLIESEQGPVLHSNPACASHFRNCMQKKAAQMKKKKIKGKERGEKSSIKKSLGIEALLKVVLLSPLCAVALLAENCSVCT